MAGKKYGAIIQARVKGAYFTLSEQEPLLDACVQLECD